MIAAAIARLLHALADRIEPEKPQPEVRTEYVYVYTAPPTYMPTPPYQWWCRQGGQTVPTTQPNICIN